MDSNLEVERPARDLDRKASAVLFPGQRDGFYPVFEAHESTPCQTWDDYLEASRRLAAVYAQHGERGFETIAHVIDMDGPDREPLGEDLIQLEVFYRICLTADTDKVPTSARKAASWAGGVQPDTNTPAAVGSPKLGCPVHKAYVMMIKSLKEFYLAEVAEAGNNDFVPAIIKGGVLQILAMENTHHLAHLVQAALGAADASMALEMYMLGDLDDWKRSVKEIVGGGCTNTDEVTPWICQWVSNFMSAGGWEEECSICQEPPFCRRAQNHPQLPASLRSKQTATADARDLNELCYGPDRATDANSARDLDAAADQAAGPLPVGDRAGCQEISRREDAPMQTNLNRMAEEAAPSEVGHVQRDAAYEAGVEATGVGDDQCPMHAANESDAQGIVQTPDQCGTVLAHEPSEGLVTADPGICRPSGWGISDRGCHTAAAAVRADPETKDRTCNTLKSGKGVSHTTTPQVLSDDEPATSWTKVHVLSEAEPAAFRE